MADNPLLLALVASAQSGDTYSAWMSFRAFLTRRLRSQTIATTSLDTYTMLITALEKAAAPTLDAAMATDLCDAFLEVYRRDGQRSLRSDVMEALLQQLRDAFCRAVHVGGRRRTAAAQTANATAGGDVAEISLGESVVVAVFSSPSASTSEVPLQEKIAVWLAARAAFAEKVVGAVLAELRGEAASDGEASATVREWLSVCVRDGRYSAAETFSVWLKEIADVRVQFVLVQELLYRHTRRNDTSVSASSSPAPAGAEEKRWRELLNAVNSAMEWIVHAHCGTSAQAEATLGALLQYLLVDFGGLGGVHLLPPPASRNVRTMQLELVASLFHEYVLGHVYQDAESTDACLDEDLVSSRDVDQLWKLFPITATELRAVCLPVCVGVLQRWLTPQASTSPEVLSRDDAHLIAYTRFLVALLCFVQHTPAPPRADDLQARYTSVVQLLCQRFEATLAQTPELKWEPLVFAL